jgi:FkbM family methyltransferase
MVTIKTNLGSFNIDKSGDYYANNDIFEKFVAEKWEPDTALYIRNYCDSRTIFLDIGASNAIFTLYASLIAKYVYAFEPLDSIYNIAKTNIGLNPKLSEKIILKPFVVSNETKYIQATQPIEPKILSSITHKDSDEFSYPLHVKSLVDIIDEIHPLESENLVIKMDIEGAEYKILQDSKIIECLANHKSVLLIAFHPGFFHPIKKSKIKIVRIYRKVFFWGRNIFDIYRIIQLIPSNTKILRTNQTPISNRRDLILLILGGYYEFIFDFSTE